jgi:two-component system sensor histidine kinase KdpD
MRPARLVLAGVGIPAAATALAAVADAVSTTTAALVYVVAVMLAAALGGRVAGLVAAGLSFLGLNFFFTHPLHTFRVARIEDVVALLVFLSAALFVATLLSIVIEQRIGAQQQEAQARLLHQLGNRLLAGRPIEEVVETFAHDAMGLLGASGCEVRLDTTEGPVVATAGSLESAGAQTSIVPVRSGERDVGHIAIASEDPIGRGTAELGVLQAFATQLGLALEGARLASEADRARMDAETSSMRAALFASVTHDLRTPLASITASVTNLLDPEARMTEEDRSDLLGTILHEARRLNRLVGNLLDLARIRAGAVDAIKLPASINEVIEGTVARLQPTLGDTRIRLLLRDDVPDVPMDVDHIDQVITNVVENGARHSPRGSEITISTAVWREAVEVRISDHGDGIPPEERDRVFQPFVRSDTMREGGAGLGLSIARALVEEHGGRIWIESAPGGGTAVIFRLPERAG